MNTPRKVPVSILTGFLGSGKTTLLNRILSEEHGKRIAVIENEYGEVGIDQALVINADEEIFEMANGCICCTVRGDLIRVLGNLMKRRDKFDYVLVETTGLADPGPVAQTFFMDDEIRAEFALDGIVTLVDAAHIEQQLGRSDESTEQIAFADVLVLNKTDLVNGEALDSLEARLRDMNRMARVVRSERANVSVDTVLNLGAFDLDQVLERRPTFLEPEYPFEWTGVYSLDIGRYELGLADGPDPAMSLVVVSDQGTDDAALREGAEWCVRQYAEPAELIRPGEEIPLGKHVNLLLDSPGRKSFFLEVDGVDASFRRIRMWRDDVTHRPEGDDHGRSLHHRGRLGETQFSTPRRVGGRAGRVPQEADAGEGAGVSVVAASMRGGDGGVRERALLGARGRQARP